MTKPLLHSSEPDIFERDIPGVGRGPICSIGDCRRPTGHKGAHGPAIERVEVKPWVPPGKGPVEPERVAGVSNPVCDACLEPITGRYSYAGYGAYRYHRDRIECYKIAQNLPSPELRLRQVDEAKSVSALGVPVAEIRENVLPSNTKALDKVVGRKDDSEKLRYSLLPWEAVTEVVRVLEYGARKYTPDNWRKVSTPRKRYTDAALRHILAWAVEGERNDSESGLHHLGHAVCCLLFILAIEVLPSVPKPGWDRD